MQSSFVHLYFSAIATYKFKKKVVLRRKANKKQTNKQTNKHKHKHKQNKTKQNKQTLKTLTLTLK